MPSTNVIRSKMKRSMTVVQIYVAYATASRQVEIPLTMETPCTVIEAIDRSSVLTQFSDIDLSRAVVGIHSRKVPLDRLLEAGDRIEIYRPLQIDPKQARRLRVKKDK